MNETKRICVWSGPRNISTALMYSFAQRADTTVFDEPHYAYYLATTDADEYHPGAAETLATYENDGEKVTRDIILGDHETPVAFFKQMTHFLPGLDWSFMKQTVNVILTRDPKDVLLSYSKNIENPIMRDVGFAAHGELLDYLHSIGQEPPVLDSQAVLENPRGVLSKLCDQIGIPFDEAMLAWEPGARPEDGTWAKYWYHNVQASSGFGQYRPKNNPLPDHLIPLYEECLPHYEQLSKLAIRA